MSRLQIRLMSDLHLAPVISDSAPSQSISSTAQQILETLSSSSIAGKDDSVLILAGDIGDSYSDPYRRLLLSASKAYKYVILIPGNHEYYTDGKHDMNVVKQHLGRLCRETGTILLDNADIVIKGFRFVGSTCWPLIPQEQYKVLKRESYGLVTRITKDSHRMDYSDFRRLHDIDVQYLQKTVRDSPEPCIVVTHYPPSGLMIDDRYEHSPQISIHFNEGLIDLVAKTQGATPLWCSGHSHVSKRIWVRAMNTLLVSNCVEGGNYDPDFVVDLTTSSDSSRRQGRR